MPNVWHTLKNTWLTPQQSIVDITTVFGRVFSLSACHPPAPLTPAAFPFFFFSLPCCYRIRALTASLSSYTSKRKRKRKQEGRGGRGHPTDKRRGATEGKKKGGKTSKWQRRRRTGNRRNEQDWCRKKYYIVLELWSNLTSWVPQVNAGGLGRVHAEMFVKWADVDARCRTVYIMTDVSTAPASWNLVLQLVHHSK